jgi:hypothetical protein
MSRMRRHAPECTPPYAAAPARLPFCLPQNASGFTVPRRFELDAATDFRRCFEDHLFIAAVGISVLNRNPQFSLALRRSP